VPRSDILRRQADDSRVPAEVRWVQCQSTVLMASDRCCEGVSAQLSAPCAEFFDLACVLTLDVRVFDVVTPLSGTGSTGHP